MVPPEQALQSKQKQQAGVDESLSPLTLPLVLQQGLQQDCPTKFGNVMPPHIHELHIRTNLQKDVMGRNAHDILCRAETVGAYAREGFAVVRGASSRLIAPRTGGTLESCSSGAASLRSGSIKSPRG